VSPGSLSGRGQAFSLPPSRGRISLSGLRGRHGLFVIRVSVCGETRGQDLGGCGDVFVSTFLITSSRNVVIMGVLSPGKGRKACASRRSRLSLSHLFILLSLAVCPRLLPVLYLICRGSGRSVSPFPRRVGPDRLPSVSWPHIVARTRRAGGSSWVLCACRH